MWEHGRLILILFGLLSLAACNSWRDASLANQGNVQLSVSITSPQRDQVTNSRVVEARVSLTGAPRIYKPPYPNQALQLCLEHEPPCLPIGRP